MADNHHDDLGEPITALPPFLSTKAATDNVSDSNDLRVTADEEEDYDASAAFCIIEEMLEGMEMMKMIIRD